MEIEAGPILSFREQKKKASKHFWEVSILVVVHQAFKDSFKLEGIDAQKKVLYNDVNSCFLRFDLSIEQEKTEKKVHYQIHNHTYYFTVPGTSTPLHFGFASCNGFSDLSLMKDIKNRSIMWERLNEAHEKKNYHILLLGGDQVYADTVWSDVPTVRAWKNLPLEKRRLEFSNATMEAELDNYYANLYKRIWSYTPVQKALASIPTLMMWDDHEIFDGWGSYPDLDQNCPVYQKIYEIARKYFLLFQQQISPDETEKRPGMLCSFSNLSLGFKVNQCLILLLDLRSQRSQTRIIAVENWNKIFSWYEKIKSEQFLHLLLISSIPIVYPNFTFLQKTLALIPRQQELEDDLQDHWTSKQHKEERLRLIHRLFAFSKDKMCRVTILAGDVHVGALGILESQRALAVNAGNSSIINQLISSAIVHPPPKAIVLFGLELLVKLQGEEEIDRGIKSYLAKIPLSESKILGSRNWLGLEFDELHRIWAKWFVEKEESPYVKVIHPVTFDGEINKNLTKTARLEEA